MRAVLSHLPLVGQRWDPVARRRWLLELLPAGSEGAEIGAWRGDFSAAILATVKPHRLHLIDPWLSSTDAAHSGALYDVGQDQMDAVYESLLNRLRSAIHDGVVVVHRSKSAEAAQDIPDSSLDWVYIDGDHTYEGVREDIQTYRTKVRPGGVVAGDDYVDGGMFKSGVKRAVDEAVTSGTLVLVIQRQRQFVLRRPDS